MTRTRWSLPTGWHHACTAAFALGCTLAQAQTCSVGAPTLAFAAFSPISGAALSATGTIPVSCTWPLLGGSPNVKLCLALNASQPLTLTHDGNAIHFGLFIDPSFANAWGSGPSQAIALSMTRNILGGTVTQNINVYGRIAAGQTTVPTTGSSNTVYTRAFSSVDTNLQYAPYGALSPAPDCGSAMTTVPGTPFSTNVSVINNCTIAATHITFATQSTLDRPVTGAGQLMVQCTQNDAYRVSLSGGQRGTVTARYMTGLTGTNVGYQLYLDSGYATIWGDGSSGTSLLSGIGTGLVQFIPIYARVPSQSTPAPGVYTDTVTATIQF
ncbi:secreted pili protein involved in motility and biofilm formation [Pandoraea eparura]|jgi:spore coat protein U-like protein|uniref:Secreted pili protein involved in motility and biofilm formation n=1 Tax=Pandoraea eparura TaxID=2508291 RepID=A0A5E4TXH4_9BURK|nr:spore coat protein U domain-containing protein [Pandoraea eparura]VVD92517.1 secreted pili protein involved in motility and biofilm formation [Pandoraea eparura]